MTPLSSTRWTTMRLWPAPQSWQSPFWLACSLMVVAALVLIMPQQSKAENHNSRTRLVSPLTPKDFLLAGIMDSPAHTLMHGMLRLGYVYALMLHAIDLKLQSDNSSPNTDANSSHGPSREELLKARKVFSRLIQPFLVGYPVANNILGTTEAGLLLLQQQMDYSMLRSH